MIAEEFMDKIDVCQTYFGIDDRPVIQYSYLFDTDGTIHMNKTMSRNMAVALVKQKCDINATPAACLQVSLDVIAASFIRDFNGNKIFDLPNEKICGWFIQYDPTPFANWYHKCWYYFVVNKSCFLMAESKYGIDDTLEMKTI